MNTAIRDMSFQSGDALVPARLFTPGDAPRPGVILVHGGPRAGLTYAAPYEPIAHGLVQSGFAAIMVTYRADRHDDDWRDVVNAAAFIRDLPEIKDGQLAVFGHSRGGFATLRAAAESDDITAAAVFDCSLDLAYQADALHAYAEIWYGSQIQMLGGVPAESPDRFLNAFELVGRISQPLLMMQGTNDMLAAPDYAGRFCAALTAAGNERVELRYMAGLGHYMERGFEGYRFEELVAPMSNWLHRTLA